MGREGIAAGVMALAALAAVSGCATDPKRTVMNLDTTDRKWTSRQCVAARKAVYRFNDHHNLGTVVQAVGNLVVPFAGSGATLALTSRQQHEREALNHRVLTACVSNRRVAREMEAHDRHRIIAAVEH